MKLLSAQHVFMFTLFLAFFPLDVMAQEIQLLDSQEFQTAMETKRDIQLLDVRTPEEFANGHLKNALNIDISQTTFITEAEKLDLEKPIYLYCQSGKRSARAAIILKDIGFKEIYDMEGGFSNWDANGFEKE
ncbi:rhodanese-like domain-containing protein [Aequorivita sp. SDUM287046]|uniref:Rhodanese-like domain-containing protein n=2 Tax=Aequorivita aurantiaca TaxID=3053356 RepID=A0ABT8DJ84_9FLAO|nr:rhodanese-like domain-containing protein [Aequorivita aurantiaca]